MRHPVSHLYHRPVVSKPLRIPLRIGKQRHSRAFVSTACALVGTVSLWTQIRRRRQHPMTSQEPKSTASTRQTEDARRTTGRARRASPRSSVTEARATAQRAKLDAQSEERNDRAGNEAATPKGKHPGGRRNSSGCSPTGERTPRSDARSTTTCSITWAVTRAIKPWSGTARPSG